MRRRSNALQKEASSGKMNSHETVSNLGRLNRIHNIAKPRRFQVFPPVRAADRPSPIDVFEGTGGRNYFLIESQESKNLVRPNPISLSMNKRWVAPRISINSSHDILPSPQDEVVPVGHQKGQSNPLAATGFLKFHNRGKVNASNLATVTGSTNHQVDRVFEQSPLFSQKIGCPTL